jgi:hypothetical protein
MVTRSWQTRQTIGEKIRLISDSQKVIQIAFFAILALTLIGASFIAVSAQAVKIDGIIYTYLIDDPMITLRVAQHIAQGFGPYYNVGERLAAVFACTICADNNHLSIRLACSVSQFIVGRRHAGGPDICHGQFDRRIA